MYLLCNDLQLCNYLPHYTCSKILILQYQGFIFLLLLNEHFGLVFKAISGYSIPSTILGNEMAHNRHIPAVNGIFILVEKHSNQINTGMLKIPSVWRKQNSSVQESNCVVGSVLHLPGAPTY